MKILLRAYNGAFYVWKTAKYNSDCFTVDGEIINRTNIVSVMNDTRKNYMMCSSCGDVFPINGNKFAKHKENASGVNPCLKCEHLGFATVCKNSRKYMDNKDGTFTKVDSDKVKLICERHAWRYVEVHSPDVINACRRRQCTSAHLVPISDVFTEFPGIFDDIITVDSIIENGYERITEHNGCITEYLLSSALEIFAQVNPIGIVDSFIVNGLTSYGTIVYYSKKYHQLFRINGHTYEPYVGNYAEQALEYIARLYK